MITLREWADACVHQPLRVRVPADDTAFAARKGVVRLAVRALRRATLLRLSGQKVFLQSRLARSARRLLWIHEGMPQIGDALMDLAPRSLLVEQGFQVDLFAAAHIAHLFEGDAWFRRALYRPDDIHPADYDAAIVLSHDRKALQLKRSRLPSLPWVSLQGFYDGPDFHRARFATQRLADLLDLRLAHGAFAHHSAQKLGLGAQRAAGTDATTGAIALALGGIWPERTYHRWTEVVAALRVQGLRRFVLVGAANGREIADRLVGLRGDDLELHDFVGRTSLGQVQHLLAGAAAVVCADGGLMHLALTTPAPLVALFGATIRPEWRLPIGLNGVGLQSAELEVDGVAPQHVADAVRSVMR